MFFSRKTPPQPAPAPPPKKRRFPYLILSISFCIWLVFRSLTPTLPSAESPPRLYANPSREDLRLTLLSAIEKTEKSIYLSMFGLSDPTILTAIKKKIKQQIPTTIFYDPTGSPNIQKALEGAEIHPVFQSGLMHQKVLILDDATVFLGSANFTIPSLKMHDNLVIGLVNAKVAQFLKEKKTHTHGYLRTMVGGQEIELWLLPDPKGHALADLRKKIRSSTHTLQIALFTLTHESLTEELIRAKKRGVEVTVVIDLHSALGASKKSVDTLQKGGVRVIFSQGVQLLHHKFVYIDEKMLISGSANWTKAAFSKNSDCFLILHQLNEEQRTFMNHLWRRLETTGKKPPLAFQPSFLYHTKLWPSYRLPSPCFS